jgi:hypothetical protein
MSLASLGIVSSIAGAGAMQRTQETEKAQRETPEQARAARAVESAANAAGIGQTEEDSEASDRDADGRRPWESPAAAQKSQSSDESTAATGTSKDPSGSCGGVLDLLG